MIEQGGPDGPNGQGDPESPQGGPIAGQAGPPPGGGPRQPNQPVAGQAGWQQQSAPTGPQTRQQPPAPTGPQQWQPGPPAAGSDGWQHTQAPTGPQGWQQPRPTQGYPAQAYPQPQYAQPPYSQPPYSQQPYSQQPSAPPQYGQPGFPPPPGPGQTWTDQQPAAEPPAAQPAKNRTPIILTAVALVVALVAAVGIYFFAIRDTNSASDAGKDTPQESVSALLTNLGNSDPIGVAGQLDPAEAALFTDLNADMITELKRLEVLGPQAAADSMTGTSIGVSGITFDGTDEAINDNLHIVKLSGGTITVKSDPNSIPLSDKIKSAFADQISQTQPQSQTVNIADVVAQNDGKPIRVASVQRDGKWYVSLFYTIADNAVHQAGLPNPTKADYIAPVGSASPEDAVNALIKQATAGSLEGVIAVLPPDEMGVLHDYGKLLISQADAGSASSDMTNLGVSVDKVSWAVSDVTGGKKVSIQSLTMTADGQTATITRNPDAGSITVQIPGQPTVTLDESTIDSYLTQAVGTSGLDPKALEIIKREFKQAIGVGVVTVQVGDQWYVSPVRSFGDIFVSLLKGLEPGDVDYLISLAGN